MPTFSYTARDKAGKVVKGTLIAMDRTAASATLLEKNLVPILIKDGGSGNKGFSLPKLKFGQKIKLTDKVVFTRQLATMVNAGVPLGRALNILKDQTASKPFQAIISDVAKQVEGGTSLASAMSSHHEVFSDIFINMVAAGETGGILDEVLERLADQQEKDAQIVGKVRGAMIYPAVITFAALAAFVFLMTVIVPKLGAIFEGMGTELPVYTRVMLGISNGLTKNGIWIAIAAGAIGTLVLRYIKTPNGKQQFDTLLLKLPVFGKIVAKVNLARFARTLGSLVASGIPILEALGATASAIGNSVYKNAITSVAQEVKNGKSISEPLRNITEFPPIVSQMIAVGEETGQLDQILVKLASFYEKEVDTVVEGITSIIEPILIILIGVIVGFVIVSVFGPLSSLSSGI